MQMQNLSMQAPETTRAATKRWPLLASLMLSVALHLGIAQWLGSSEPAAAPMPQQQPALSLELTLNTGGQSTLPAEPEPVEIAEPFVPAPAPSAVVVAPAVSAVQPEALPNEPAQLPLNLSRDALRAQLQTREPVPPARNPGAVPVPSDRLLKEFSPEFFERLAQHRAAQAQRQLLRERAIARDGVAPEDYHAENLLGEVIKTEQGCFALRNEIGLNGQETRWWITGCNEERVSAWEQSVLSFQ